MGWRWRQKWVGLGLKVRGLGWRQVAEERWVNIWVGELDQQGVEEDKKKKMKRRRVPGGLGRRQVEEEVGRNWAGEMDRSATGQVRWVREVEKERKN